MMSSCRYEAGISTNVCSFAGYRIEQAGAVDGFYTFTFLSLCQAALEKVPSRHQTAARRRPGLRLGLLVAEFGLS